MRAADTSTQPLTTAQRWDLHCAIVERYVREYKTLPERGVAYFNVNIGNWLAAQRELATLGLLSSTHQQRINNLDILLAEMNPTSLSDLLEPFRKPTPRKVPPRVAAGKAPARVTKRLSASPVLVSSEAETPRQHAPTHLTKDTSVDTKATHEPEATPEPEVTVEPEATPEPEVTVEPEATPEPEVTVEPEAKDAGTDDDLSLRAAAVTEFYEIHRRLPKRSESSLRAGGASLTWWTWGLVPAYADGKLDAETLDTLAVEPWWHLVIERANKLKAKRLSAAESTTEPSNTETPVTKEEVVGEPEAPAASETATEPPSSATPKVRDPDAAARRKRTVPHRRNPLAAESRSEKEAAKADEDGKVRLADLPEAGLVRLRTFDEASGTYIRANRRVSSGTAPRSMRNLSLSGIPFHAVRSKDGSGEHVIHVVLHVKSVYDALPALEALGYTYTEVSSEPLAVVAQ